MPDVRCSFLAAQGTANSRLLERARGLLFSASIATPRAEGSTELDAVLSLSPFLHPKLQAQLISDAFHFPGLRVALTFCPFLCLLPHPLILGRQGWLLLVRQ